MTPIKIYLLPLFLIFFLSFQSFSQSSFGDNQKEDYEKEIKFSKSDSLLAATYFTEKDFNERNGIEQLRTAENSDDYYGDEIYNAEGPRKDKSRNSFWGNVAAEVVVDVFVNTVFLIAVLWQ